MNKFQTPGRVKECQGSILAPENAGLKMIVAVCSQSGEYDAPFYKMITKRWSKVRDDYRSVFINRQLKMGSILETAVASDIWVIQLVCINRNIKIDKISLQKCVNELEKLLNHNKGSIHIDNSLIKNYPIINNELIVKLQNNGINFNIYNEVNNENKNM